MQLQQTTLAADTFTSSCSYTLFTHLGRRIHAQREAKLVPMSYRVSNKTMIRDCKRGATKRQQQNTLAIYLIIRFINGFTADVIL